MEQYFYHEASKTTTWDEPAEVTPVFEAMEKQQMLDRVWEKVDADGNGWLDREEVKAVLLLLGKSEDEIDMDATMKELDEDGNEEVSKEEFGPWYFALGDDALQALRKAEKQEKKKKAGEPTEPWKCDVCTTVNRSSAAKCQLCGRKDNEDAMLLCDGCDRGFHTTCLEPPLASIPEGEWHCAGCVAWRSAPKVRLAEDEAKAAEETQH